MQKLELNVFGQGMVAERGTKGWRLYFVGSEGKRRPVPDAAVPEDVITPEELVQFVDDCFHEHATTENPKVTIK